MANKEYHLLLLNAKSRDLVNMEFSLTNPTDPLNSSVNFNQFRYPLPLIRVSNSPIPSKQDLSPIPRISEHRTPLTKFSPVEKRRAFNFGEDEILKSQNTQNSFISSPIIPNRYSSVTLPTRSESNSISPQKDRYSLLRISKSGSTKNLTNLHDLSSSMDASRQEQPTVKLRAVQRSHNNTFTTDLLKKISSKLQEEQSIKAKSQRSPVKPIRDIEAISPEKKVERNESIIESPVKTTSKIKSIVLESSEPTESLPPIRVSRKPKITSAARIFSLQQIMNMKLQNIQKDSKPYISSPKEGRRSLRNLGHGAGTLSNPLLRRNVCSVDKEPSQLF